jgi:hypothetical protein
MRKGQIGRNQTYNLGSHTLTIGTFALGIVRIICRPSIYPKITKKKGLIYILSQKTTYTNITFLQYRC